MRGHRREKKYPFHVQRLHAGNTDSLNVRHRKRVYGSFVRNCKRSEQHEVTPDGRNRPSSAAQRRGSAFFRGLIERLEMGQLLGDFAFQPPLFRRIP